MYMALTCKHDLYTNVWGMHMTLICKHDNYTKHLRHEYDLYM